MAEDGNGSKSKPGRPKKENPLKTYTTRMQDEYLKKLRSFAYYKRTSQREVIEKALEEFFEGREEDLEEALELWEEEDNDSL